MYASFLCTLTECVPAGVGEGEDFFVFFRCRHRRVCVVASTSD